MFGSLEEEARSRTSFTDHTIDSIPFLVPTASCRGSKTVITKTVVADSFQKSGGDDPSEGQADSDGAEAGACCLGAGEGHAATKEGEKRGRNHAVDRN